MPPRAKRARLDTAVDEDDGDTASEDEDDRKRKGVDAKGGSSGGTWEWQRGDKSWSVHACLQSLALGECLPTDPHTHPRPLSAPPPPFHFLMPVLP